MFSGAHMVIFSEDAEADRSLIHDLLGRSAVDAGGGWMIYEMPPAELAIHPPHGPIRHELHLMCDNIKETCQELETRGLTCDPIEDLGYGLVSAFTLPGGSTIGFYEPRHKRPG